MFDTLPESAARPRGLADLIQLKKSLGIRNKNDLLAMSSKRDPFNCGGPADWRDAEWFAERWSFHGFTGVKGVHLRKLHYRIVALGEQAVPLPRPVNYLMDGRQVTATTYKNHLPIWKYLIDAGAKARYLNLLEPDAFDDRRNPDPAIHARPFWETEPSWWVTDCDRWMLPTIRADLAHDLNWSFPSSYVDGYDYDAGSQPYLLEIWCEKSTMDALLEPICRRFNANLVTAMGFQSITAALHILDRARKCAMPTRIVYVSDFDPAGDKMAPAVARQVEFWFERYAPGVDVKIDAIVLTPEQVRRWNLPTAPIKASDKRAQQFLERYGVDGAVELDALDTLHPGVLETIVTEALEPYRDNSLANRLRRAEMDAQHRVDQAIAPVRHDAARVLGEIRSDAKEILSRYQERLAALAEELTQDFQPLQDRLDDLRERVETDLTQIKIELPPRPKAEIALPDESGWLFDSDRDYLEQLAAYKARHADANDDEAAP